MGGESEEEARQRAEEATKLYLDTVAEQGDLEHVLAEKGVTVGYEGDPPLGHFEERTLLLPLGAG